MFENNCYIHVNSPRAWSETIPSGQFLFKIINILLIWSFAARFSYQIAFKQFSAIKTQRLPNLSLL